MSSRSIRVTTRAASEQCKLTEVTRQAKRKSRKLRNLIQREENLYLEEARELFELAESFEKSPEQPSPVLNESRFSHETDDLEDNEEEQPTDSRFRWSTSVNRFFPPGCIRSPPPVISPSHLFPSSPLP